jgi:hypothetical protein
MKDLTLLEMFKLAGVDATTGKANKLIEDTKVDYQVRLIQDKFDVSRKEALKMYHEDGTRVEERREKPRPKE